jgi:acetylornithine/succinyldiaminopimelate/putrescine aminotransferase
MQNISRSLEDLLGKEYTRALCSAQAFLTGENVAILLNKAQEKVDFFPTEFAKKVDKLVELTGQKVCEAMPDSLAGAPTQAFANAQNNYMSPLSGLGCTRLGEDGRAYFIGKSEHYHAPLGHQFPGYKLLQTAAELGMLNATHNNTRGYVTRLLERELIRIANGLPKGAEAELQQVINSDNPHTLNRVINLETGSLAVEAALKMMLARFYKLDATFESPKYAGRKPVFLVMADRQDGKQANYHGTTVLTQMLRGMWPELADELEIQKLYTVKSVRINDLAHFEALTAEYDHGEFKIAGFFHELVLMNYGGIRLTDDFIQNAHKICTEHDIPTMVDEIQSCMWSPEMFMFKEYRLSPSFVSVGKGFPGGQYPASRILTTSAMDSLNQFGALVTNGQEELASLAYLITMEFAEANHDHTLEVGKYYHNQVVKLAEEFPDYINEIEGDAHMTTLFFKSAELTNAFTRRLNKECCIDISAQTYKANCPPAALTKLPLISSKKAVNFVLGKMRETLQLMQENI